MFTLSEILQFNIILYKIGKFQKDIELFFDKLKIDCYMEDSENYCVDTIRDKKVLNIGSITKDDIVGDLIIICDFEVTTQEKKLIALGLEYGKNYIYGIDLINSLWSPLPIKEIIIFGTTIIDDFFTEQYKGFKIKYYVDNDEARWGSTFNDKSVRNPEELAKEEKGNYLVIVMRDDFIEIKTQLLGLGVREEDIYHYMDQNSCFTNVIVSKLLIRTIEAPTQFNTTCRNAFRYSHILHNGDVVLCTPSSKEFSIGNLRYHSFGECENSPFARLIRLSVINGTYCFCTDSCSNNRTGNKTFQLNKQPDNISSDYEYNSLLNNEQYMTVLNYDRTCNLSCRSCRSEHLVLNDKEKQLTELIHKKVVEGVLPRSNHLIVTGNGDPFFSKYYREVIFDKYKGDTLQLQTNGLLMTEQYWENLKGKYKKVRLEVSIDAATKKTYEYLRRGGDFARLMKNLEYAAHLRTEGVINWFRISFVVQKDNFREMEKFIKIGLHLGADMITFSPISNWLSIPEEEFIELDLMDERNKYHRKFSKMIKKPIFKNEKVYFGFKLHESDKEV